MKTETKILIRNCVKACRKEIIELVMISALIILILI